MTGTSRLALAAGFILLAGASAAALWSGAAVRTLQTVDATTLPPAAVPVTTGSTRVVASEPMPTTPVAVREVGAGVGVSGEFTGALPHVALGPSEGLKAALEAVDSKDYGAAMQVASSLTDTERNLVTWLAIRRGLDGLTPRAITEFARNHPNWPSAKLMRQRAEQALARANLAPADLVRAYENAAPVSDTGLFSLVRAYRAVGRTDDARQLLAAWWSDETLSASEDAAILKTYGDLLTTADHRARFAMLLSRDRIAQATNLAKLVGADAMALVTARAAVVRGARDAAAKLAAVPAALQKDPIHVFSLVEWHRRHDRPKEAAEALLTLTPEAIGGDADEWWVERRIISRDLVEAGNAKLAYAVVASHRGGSVETRQEAAFHAGWYALRFLNDPAKAIPHFEALQEAAGKPISRARAAYWLGRAEEAAGRLEDARRHYTIAAADEVTFYGQLARVKLGKTGLEMPPLPEPTAADRKSFSENELVRAIGLLLAAGREGDAAPLYPELARQLPSGGQIRLLSEFIQRRGDHRLALQIGKIAAERGLGVEQLAFPVESIPESARDLTAVETAMVYAIARQESAFDPGAVSKAGARGLLQLMPATAAATARKIGVDFAPSKLTEDPGLNAQLGAAHLKELVDAFGGSYILSFAAYNAGPGKAREWIRRFGDPRDPKVDPVDWIELIPYGETRNYVQRVTENLQVYRDRLTPGPLAIATDLRRGSG